MAQTQKGYTERTRDFLKKPKVKYFIAGMVTAYAIKKFTETDLAHNIAVSATAGALNIRDGVEEGIENIREDAEDIHAEAEEKQKIEIYEVSEEEKSEE